MIITPEQLRIAIKNAVQKPRNHAPLIHMARRNSQTGRHGENHEDKKKPD
jgi:hypothetical protein